MTHAATRLPPILADARSVDDGRFSVVDELLREVPRAVLQGAIAWSVAKSVDGRKLGSRWMRFPTSSEFFGGEIGR